MKGSLLLALPLLLSATFYLRLFLPRTLGRAIVVRGDFTNEFFALHAYAYRALQSGRLPLWNPNTYAGYPYLGDVQTAVFYPLHLLIDGALILAGIPHLPIWALELLLPIHVCLAAFFTYALARAERLPWASTLLAGLGFAFGGYLLSYPQQQLSILETVIWLPAILAALAQAAEARTAIRRAVWLVAAGWAFGIALLAGHPQTVLFMSYAMVAYALSRSLYRSDDCDVNWKRKGTAAIFGVSVVVLLGILLAAAQLAPSLELFHLSTRETMPYAVAAHGFRWSDFISLARPASFFTRSLYVGPLFLSLGVVAVITRRQGPVLFWAALGVAGLLLSLGGNGPLYPLLYRVGPGFNLFRDQERAVLLTSLAMAMLAGHGLAALLNLHHPRIPGKAARQTSLRTIWISLGLVGVTTLFFLVVRSSAPAEGARPALALSATGMLALVAVATRRVSFPVGSTAIIALAALSLVRLSWFGNFAPIQDVPVYPSTAIVRYLREHAGSARVTTGGLWPADHGYVDGLAEISGMSEMRLRRYVQLRHRLRRERFLRMAGVRYLVSWQSDLAKRPRWHNRLRLLMTEGRSPFTGAPLYLYEIKDTPALATSLERVRFVKSSAAAFRVMNTEEFDPGTEAVAISSTPGATITRPSRKAGVAIRSWQAGSIVLDVTSATRADVLVRQMDYPGWRAKVDGIHHPIHRLDVGFQGIQVGPGHHIVLLQYDPFSVKIGVATSLITAAGSLLFLVGLSRWPRVIADCPRAEGPGPSTS